MKHHKKWIAAALLLMLLLLTACGTEQSPEMEGDMKPHFMVNGRLYWASTHPSGTMPESFQYAGDIVEKAKTKELFADPKHPYTIGLMNSIPDIDDEHERLNTLEGLVPSLYEMPKGCRFAPRCQFACAECEQNRIHLTDLENGRQVRCRRYENV